MDWNEFISKGRQGALRPERLMAEHAAIKAAGLKVWDPLSKNIRVGFDLDRFKNNKQMNEDLCWNAQIIAREEHLSWARAQQPGTFEHKVENQIPLTSETLKKPSALRENRGRICAQT